MRPHTSPQRLGILLVFFGVVAFTSILYFNYQKSFQTLSGLLIEFSSFNGYTFIDSTLESSEETIQILVGEHGIIDCPTTVLPGYRMMTPSDFTVAGLILYEYSPGFTQELQGDWLGERYYFNEPTGNTLTTLKAGHVYYVRADETFDFACMTFDNGSSSSSSS